MVSIIRVIATPGRTLNAVEGLPNFVNSALMNSPLENAPLAGNGSASGTNAPRDFRNGVAGNASRTMHGHQTQSGLAHHIVGLRGTLLMAFYHGHVQSVLSSRMKVHRMFFALSVLFMSIQNALTVTFLLNIVIPLLLLRVQEEGHKPTPPLCPKVGWRGRPPS